MIGVALKVGRTNDDIAVWALRVNKVDISGYWIIIDRRFVPVEYSARVRNPLIAWLRNVLQVAGYLGVCGSVPWTITIWITGNQVQDNRFVMPGIGVALLSLALAMCGRLGASWLHG
jgi:hypothetical protein